MTNKREWGTETGTGTNTDIHGSKHKTFVYILPIFNVCETGQLHINKYVVGQEHEIMELFKYNV